MAARLNLNKLRAAMSGPGADSRQWAGYVILSGDPMVEAEGVFVTGVIEPAGVEVSLQIPPLWSVRGCAGYVPVHEGDKVLAVFPTGEPSGGGIMVSTTFNSEDSPPPDSLLLPDDIWLVIPEGRDLRLRVTGGGAVEIKAPIIVLETTGSAATSRVVIDGVPWSGVQLQTPMGPTVGPPTAGPLAAPAAADVAAWQSKRAGGQ